MQKLNTGLTFEQMKALPEEEQAKLFKQMKKVRTAYKTVNYSATYGVGAAKLARETGLPPKDAKGLLDAYWQRNHSVVKATESFKVKLVGNSMWLQNPVSKFWHNLRSEKDRFSTANQSTGVYCFDTWLSFCREAKIKIAMQFHDEVGFYIPEIASEYIGGVLKGAIKKANDKLKLNVHLDVDVQIGRNYAETH